MSNGETTDPLSISFGIADQSSQIVRMLVIGFRADGSTFTFDTGMTADEAKEMCRNFISWIDTSLGREMERESRGEN